MLNHRLTISLTDAQYAWLVARAEALGVSLPVVIRLLVAQAQGVDQ